MPLMMGIQWTTIGGRGISLALVVAASLASAASDQPPRRAAPPKWTADVLDAFFEDAREQLAGARPAPSAAAVVQDRSSSAGPVVPSDGFAWSQLIDEPTITDEVKRAAAKLAAPLANPSKFKAGGYQECRLRFSVLAVLFAVVAEHDDRIRWKDQAGLLRDAFARAGANCKVGTDQSYAEAKRRHEDLTDIVRGQRLAGDESGRLEKWSTLADRGELMKRMEAALEERISPALASAATFQRESATVKHEAQMLAVLAEVIGREAYDYWDDEEFAAMADQLRSAAVQLSESAAKNDHEPARSALAAATKSCSDCHDSYRG